ncbi:cationic amino acid transporter 4 [Pristis pectinata]|uniref:cationic amino acid transporter 4 n=1 Tax=Pristis pectinata TaxID=685728 RepID=UPI00223DD5C9|nr:cationic amino acid transporter 4 [Pristis pectinata]XP_051888206.1 cationic amino acid transporter 4 [Pristis pectinata]XP_051888207.1 cationic amino acid transporter 4 [Pristis pectinata]XP_051888208.1 cationic amino acid transporter 4 [Pristis pectinata]
MVSRLLSGNSLARFCQKLNRVKTLEENMMETALNRCLSTLDLTMLGIGGMVGSGLYVLTGTVAKDVAGPAVIISFIFAGFASLLAAFCYAEFGSRVPKTGSAYMFTYVSVGEIWAFMIGWNIILEYMIGGAAVARAWSGYLDSIFNHKIRNFTETYIATWNVPFLAPNPDMLAAGILLVATAFITCGAKVSSWLNHVFSAISLGVILFILIFGFILADPTNYSAKEGGFAPFGFSGIMAGTATCFFAFVGFDVIAASSEEARNPQKSIPIATAISLGLATVAYTLVSTVLTLMVPWHSLNPDSALSDAFYRRGYSWAGFIVAVGSICAMNTVLLSNLFSLPRIAYAMSEDGLLFKVFSQVNPVTKVPVLGIVVFGILMAILALVFDLESLVQFLSIGTLLAYTFVAASIIVLRYRMEKADASQLPAPNQSPQPQDSGGLKEYESFSDKLQLVERQKSTKEKREPGQLKSSFEPYLHFLDSFAPGELVMVAVVTLVGCSTCLGCILIFGSSYLHLPQWAFILFTTLFTIGFLISLFLIWIHEQQQKLCTFQVPLVPLIPAVSILLNVFLMLKLSLMTWVRFTVWLAIGFLVYFGYGIWHSKENLKEPKPRNVSARYVVLPSGSLVETVQTVQPESQGTAGLGEVTEEEEGR